MLIHGVRTTRKRTGRNLKSQMSKVILNNSIMLYLSMIAQLIVAVSIVIVWVFRFDNIVIEFKQYGLSDLTRMIIGSAKIALATLLVAGIWYSSLVLIPALMMAFLMICAQYFHFKVSNPWPKRMPSLALLLLCLFITGVSLNLLS